ncbi:dGTPase [Corallococcus sp. 4LFB]|uniref:dGTPase n=1 Tax=Corallococcus sp. 4LFB TaxID=3383249 RepID=UPI0039770A1C
MAEQPVYARLLSKRRLRPSSVKNRSLANETESDYGRVLYSAALRRLQQKTQVFPLADNAAVRSRLTHSLEVAYVGRLLALKVVEIVEKRGLSKAWGLAGSEIPFRNTIETACLSHDIGNPPFGHFGEYAVRKWFELHGQDTLRAAVGAGLTEAVGKFNSRCMPDFTQFDGNAQGFRILTRLQWNLDEFGLNLTMSQLAAFLKYMRAPYEKEGGGRFTKKAGYFLTEEPIVRKIWAGLGLERGRRHPLAYAMEASDDIAYCVSDIEDALEKGLVDQDEFKRRLRSIWLKLASEEKLVDKKYLVRMLDEEWRRQPDKPRNARFFSFKTRLTRELTEVAAKVYVEKHDEILKGESPSLLECAKEQRVALDALKKYAQMYIFKAPDAERLELAGFQVVDGLLQHLSPLLKLHVDAFDAVRAGERVSGLDLERRLFRLLPQKHVLVYEDARARGLGHLDVKDGVAEWFARAHLVVDFVSGMTDRFALETYQLLAGIRV